MSRPCLCVMGWFLFFQTSVLAADFSELKVTADAEGFINLIEGQTQAERFFPLATFFYPALPPGSSVHYPPTVDYQAFANMGGNLVVCPWAPNLWPDRPGALFATEGSCINHLNAAAAAGVKVLADPTLFWGNAGQWQNEGQIIDNTTRQTWFNQLVSWVEASQGEGAFMGYYSWDKPAWRYVTSAELPPQPTPAYLTAATAHLRILEAGEAAHHAVFLVQSDAFKVRDLWVDYFNPVNIAGSSVLPFPEPSTLQSQNETPTNPRYRCLLPNYYSSVTGSLADAVHETALYPADWDFRPSRCKPCIAVLQGKKIGGSAPTLHQMRFQAYDAIIHGAKGLAWYDDNDFSPVENAEPFYKDLAANIEDLLDEFTVTEINGVLNADYDNTLVLVDTYTGTPPNENYVERTSLIGGKILPKSHFLSDQIMVETVAKRYNGKTYVIAARRPNVNAGTSYTVRFRPCFSAFLWYDPWSGDNGYIRKYVGDGSWVQVPVASGYAEGYWVDTFAAGDVNIYRFTPPATGEPE
jgi:hypothetical protein